MLTWLAFHSVHPLTFLAWALVALLVAMGSLKLRYRITLGVLLVVCIAASDALHALTRVFH